MVGADEASIGPIGRPTWRPKLRSPSRPWVSAVSATVVIEPDSISARRISAEGTSAARAMASAITPSSAPWCSSPDSSRRRNACSLAVARPNSSSTSCLRVACEPLPDAAPIAVNAASTSVRVSVAVSAGGGAWRSVAQPTPICRWGSSPDR